VVFPPFEADLFERARGHGMALRGGLAAVDQWQLHVFLCRGAGQQIEALEHEAEVTPAQAGPLVAAERLHLHALELIGAGGGCVQAAQRVHGRGLARTAGAHDGHKVTLLDVQIHAFERLERRFPCAVDLGDAAQTD
jgi:hypothetical protein